MTELPVLYMMGNIFGKKNGLVIFMWQRKIVNYEYLFVCMARRYKCGIQTIALFCVFYRCQSKVLA